MTRHHRPLFTSVATAVLLSVAACSGNDTDDAAATTSTETSAAQASAGDGTAATPTSVATGGAGAGNPDPVYSGTPTGPGAFELCGSSDAPAVVEVRSAPADPDQLVADGWEQRAVGPHGAVDYVDTSGQRWVRLYPTPDGAWVQVAAVTCS